MSKWLGRLLILVVILVGVSYYQTAHKGLNDTGPAPDWSKVTLTDFETACLTPSVGGVPQEDSSPTPAGKYPPFVGDLIRMFDSVGSTSSYAAVVDGAPVQVDCAIVPPPGIPGAGGVELPGE